MTLISKQFEICVRGVRKRVSKVNIEHIELHQPSNIEQRTMDQSTLRGLLSGLLRLLLYI